ncbi:aminotransferase [Virgibacillus soli]|nr:aminotransferase [Virgibacillus soli]
MPIQVTKSSMPPFEEYIDEIKGLWETRWLTNNGEKHRQLENDLNEFLRTPNISLFNNGHQALEAIINTMNLTGEVVTTPFTFVSTTHAIVRNGLNPIFCEINPEDLTIDTDRLESLITDKTSAILPVHVYGNICNVESIEEIARKYDLKVIYDAAHAFGEEKDGVPVGNFGDASMFSFHATKVFHTIEGGAVTFKDASLKSKIESYKNFGITNPESIDYIGTNAKMNEFQAAMGLCNLRYVQESIKKREVVSERYLEHLEGLDGIKLPTTQQNINRNYAYFPVVFDGYLYSRDEIMDRLSKNDIFARKYFYPLTNEINCYNYNSKQTPIAKHISDRILTLPIYPDLELDIVDKICKIIKGKW